MNKKKCIVAIGSATILAGLVFFALIWLQEAGRAARQSQCRSNLKQVGFALLQYIGIHGHLPPTIQYSDSGEKLYSWRALVHPYLGTDVRSHKYTFDEPWNSKANIQFATMPEIGNQRSMSSPLHTGNPIDESTSFFAIVGESTIFRAKTPRVLTPEYIAEHPDKIILCEYHGKKVVWTEPTDVSVEELLRAYCHKESLDENSHWRGSKRNRVAHVFRLDGRTEEVKLPMNKEELIERVTY